MSNYLITRSQLLKRLIAFKVDTTESNAIIGALFSYLHNVGLSYPKPAPFQPQLLKLAYFDFKFLYYLYFEDSFLQDFIHVFRDYNNSVIEFSEDSNIYNRRIRDMIGIEDRTNGLYPYILQYRTKSLEQLHSTETQFLIDNTEAEAFSTPATKSKVDLFMKAEFQQRTDDKQSFTDSIAKVNSRVNVDVNTSTLPDDYKPGNTQSIDDFPYMNGTPGSNSRGPKDTVNSKPVELDSVNVVNSFKSQLERSEISKYPVLNFILKRSSRPRGK